MKLIIIAALIYFHATLSSSDKAPNYSFMHEATTSQDISYYDYIIIGGGTAGCPLAATLSQKYKVLLLERGGSPYGNPNITKLSEFLSPVFDTSSSSPAQNFISEDGVVNTRARVLGGGTCLNAGFYTRAATSYVKASGWKGQLVNESYKWVEKKMVFRPIVKEWQSALKDGLVEVGVKPDNGFTYDHLIGTKVGGTIFDTRGLRHTAADLLEHANSSKLTILLHATVHKILFEHKGKLRPIAYGVVFSDAKGRKHRAYLKTGGMNEIIISAGAVGSPQLLMLSGIGPLEQLKAHNISVVLEQPMVGQRMADNPMNVIAVPSPVPVETSAVQVVGITPFGSYIESASGINFLRLPGIPSSSPEMGSGNDLRGGFILQKVKGPLSRGHIELRSQDPNDNPSVTFNYYKEPKDLQKCVKGMKVIERVVFKSKSFSKFRDDSVVSSFSQLLNITSNGKLNLLPQHENTSQSLEQFCKDTVVTIWHFHGGCQVGKVVDGDYKVLGVDNLRVVDSSTFDYSPGTNPQATVMMIGRYVGVRILDERLAKEKNSFKWDELTLISST